MGKILLQEKERYLHKSWNAASYYDYPDGQDLIGKLTYTNKLASIGGSFLGLAYATNYHPLPTTWREKFLRYFQVLIPSLGAATVFTCVTYLSTNLRKEDDAINYAIGGIAAGFSLIPVNGRVSLGVSAAIIFASFAVFKKITKMQNQDLFPNRIAHKNWSSYYDRQFDFSLEPNNGKRNWTK